jgi:hypothetical protein
MDAPGAQNNVEHVIRVRANYGTWKFFRAPSALRFATPLTSGITCNAWAFSSRALLLLCVLLERTTVDENNIVTAVLSSPDAQDALRVIARIAIREVALRANSSPPVEDVTVIGDMTIDRLRHTVSVDGARVRVARNAGTPTGDRVLAGSTNGPRMARPRGRRR